MSTLHITLSLKHKKCLDLSPVEGASRSTSLQYQRARGIRSLHSTLEETQGLQAGDSYSGLRVTDGLS